MPEQLTYYHETRQLSPFCHRVEIALVETGASYKSFSFELSNKPAWFTKVNPQYGKIPAITYGGPDVPPEEPSPLSFKLTESCVILEFLADLYPGSSLLPPVSDVTGRARVRRFMDAVRHLDQPLIEFLRGLSGNSDKVVECLEKIQALLPDPEVEEGEFAIGKTFTNADCAIAPLLVLIDMLAKTDIGNYKPGQGTQLGEILGSNRFERLSRYKKALFERESVKKVLDLDRLRSRYRGMFTSPSHKRYQRSSL